MMKKTGLVILFIFAGWFVASACNCPPETADEKTMQSYDFVFYGKVVSVNTAREKATVTFSIVELYKGKSFAETTLEFDNTTDCQMSFTAGEEWLIYSKYVAYGTGRADLCSLSRKKADAGGEDFYTVSHGMSFSEEQARLLKIFGKQALNEESQRNIPHHELLHPRGWQPVWLLACGVAVLFLFYYLVKKLLR